MTIQNAYDVVDVANVVDQVVISHSELMNLSDSIYAPKRPSVVNLPPKDLHHRLNALRHKPTSDQPGFLLFNASSIPGINRLDKLNLIRDLAQLLKGYIDLNWMYHDYYAAIIVEFVNQQLSQQAQ